MIIFFNKLKCKHNSISKNPILLTGNKFRISKENHFNITIPEILYKSWSFRLENDLIELNSNKYVKLISLQREIVSTCGARKKKNVEIFFSKRIDAFSFRFHKEKYEI